MIIVVESTRKDAYGNLFVTDKEEKEHKIAEKRFKLHELFQEGVAVELFHKVYKDVKYVDDAKLVSGKLADLPATQPKELQGEGAGETKEKIHPTSAIAPQKEGMLWKEVGELYRGGKLAELFGFDNATNVLKAYRAEILGGLRIPFDGAKLPGFEKKGVKTE